MTIVVEDTQEFIVESGDEVVGRVNASDVEGGTNSLNATQEDINLHS